MQPKLLILLFVISISIFLLVGSSIPTKKPFTNTSSLSNAKAVSECSLKDVQPGEPGFKNWSPDHSKYLVNKKDSAGIYQIYVGQKGSDSPACITCMEKAGGPKVGKHKMQSHWHPSGKWIVTGAEMDQYNRPLLPDETIESLMLSGAFLNIYAVTPDGNRWTQLTNFKTDGLTEFGEGGFTGVAFTPDGKTGVYARSVNSNIFAYTFGKWKLFKVAWSEDSTGLPSFANSTNITPANTNWLEPGNFAPDGRRLLLSADTNFPAPNEAEGQDQYILDITTGVITNLTNTPKVWDEHGVFSPDGKKVFWMSSYPFRDDPNSYRTLSLKAEFMLMNDDGSDLQQLTHFFTPGFPEYNPGLAAIGGWEEKDGLSIIGWQLLGLNQFKTWNINFNQPCGVSLQSLPGDLDNNGVVDIFDYNIIIGNFGRTGTGIIGDIDGNDIVDIFDYNILVGNFGKSL